MFFGAPGLGKTAFVHAIGHELKDYCNFFVLSPEMILSTWLGQTERYIKIFFEMARSNAPCIVFIDEAEQLCGTRSKHDSTQLKGILLTQTEPTASQNKDLIIFSATNFPHEVDSAFRYCSFILFLFFF